MSFFLDARLTALRFKASAPTEPDEFLRILSDFLTDRQSGLRESSIRAGVSVLGSSRDLIFSLLQDKAQSDQVRIDIVRFIGFCGGVNEAYALRGLLLDSASPENLRTEILKAMATIGGPSVAGFLLMVSESPDVYGKKLCRNAAYLYDELVDAADGGSAFMLSTVALFNASSFEDSLHELRQMDPGSHAERIELLSEASIFDEP